MQNRDGVQKGPQDHAEGQHGSKTRSKILEQLHSGNGAVNDNREDDQQRPKHLAHHNSAHRLFEDRQQHDEAERNSEKTRHNREVERGHIDRPHIPKTET
jgi:protein subunit release factor B